MDAVGFDRECIELALAEARKCRPDIGGVSPKTAAVAASNGIVLGTAFRGEFAEGEHADYSLLERKLHAMSLRGATIYTVIEPCTIRQHPKISCATRLVERGVGRVVVGLLEPNPHVAGRGLLVLKSAGVAVEFFPGTKADIAEQLNTSWLRAERCSMPVPRVHISGYEWELLESRGYIAGRTQQSWYEYFVATNDLANLERLLRIYVPPEDQIQDRRTFTLAPGQTTDLTVATDPRLISLVASDPIKLLSLTPREFELFTAELLEKLGYCDVSIGKGSKDGGVDVTAYIKHRLAVERVIVQCKRRSHEHKVGEPVVKQLITDTQIHNAARGLIVTTSYLTRGALLLVDTARFRLLALDFDDLTEILKGGTGRTKH